MAQRRVGSAESDGAAQLSTGCRKHDHDHDRAERRSPAQCRAPRLALASSALLFMPSIATAQDRGSVDPPPLPPLANPEDPGTPAKELFGRKSAPAQMEARTIGFYAKGCLAGGVALPINGRTWQVMRLSRNRNWGHPNLVRVPGTAGRAGAQDRLARAAGRRHGAAARRPDAHRPCQPPARPRRRHLAHPHARPRADPPRARGNVGDHGGAPRTAATSIRRCGLRRMSAVIKAAAQGPAASHASSSTPRSRRRCAARPAATARWLEQGAAVVGPRLSFPCPAELSVRQP